MTNSSGYIDGATWVRIWREAGPRLDAIRAEELKRIDVARFIHSTASVFEAVRARAETRTTSGLVEQQRIFGRHTG